MTDYSETFAAIADAAKRGVDVSVPGLPGGVICMKRFFHDDSIRQVVFADPRKMAKAWADQIRGEYRRAHPLKVIFGGRSSNRELALYDRSPLEQSIAHMQSLTGRSYSVPMDMPQVNFYRGKFSFTNGIHRTFNLAKLGATSIPVEISNGSDMEDFKRRFGVKTPQSIVLRKPSP